MTRTFATAAIIATLAVMLMPVSATARVLKIRERISVSSSDVLLEDLAINPEILSADERAIVAVTMAEDVVGAQRFSLINVAYALQRHSSLLDLRLNGPHWVSIGRIADPQLLSRLKMAISNELQLLSPWNAWTIELNFGPDDERRLGQVGNYDDLQVRVLDSRTMLGIVPMRVTLTTDAGVNSRSLLLAPVVSRQVEAIVVRNSLDRQHVLSSDDLETARIWIGDDSRDYVTELSECIGNELSRRLTAGELLRRSHFQAPICARRGDIVWVTYSANGLVIRLPVQALEAGRRGESVRVRNPSSEKVFSVELTGAKEARINIGS